MVEEYRGKIRAAEIVKKIRNEAGFVSPRVGFILGSGWGQVLNALETKRLYPIIKSECRSAVLPGMRGILCLEIWAVHR